MSLGLWAGLAILVLLGSYVLLVANSRPQVSGDKLRLDQFYDFAGRQRILEATVLDQDQYVIGTYERSDGSKSEFNVPYVSGGHSSMVDALTAADVATDVDHQFTKRLVEPATMILPALIVVVVFVYLILSHHRGTGLFAVRSGARKAEEVGRFTFDDVAGQDAAVTELREVRDFLSDPERFSALGAQVPKGILLFGPPGCGKTLLARAVAGEAGAAFYSISGSDFVEVYVGVGASRVRDLFREARENAPAIVFIDELDSVGRRRSGGGGAGAMANNSMQEQEQTLNQILAEMDGFSPMEGIIVLAATNRPDILDPALLRPGRFDRTIALERPDEGARLAILEMHARTKTMAPGTDLARVASKAVGLSGADLANVVNEAALLAARGGSPDVKQTDLDVALGRVLEAPDQQRRLSQRARTFVRSTGSERRVSFADVAGLDEAIAELAEVREYLSDPDRFVAMGALPPRGFLLVGPPGCGKTLLARAVATETNAAFFSVAATEFVEVYVGEGAGRVRDLFAEARGAAPAIVFIDELDAIGARRGLSGNGTRESDQTLNQILVELDGFDARTGVTVMAASNRPEILDEALVRPGRFDRTVVIDLPDRASRRAILALHAASRPMAASIDLDAVAGITQSFSGADLANVVNEAALLAARAHRDEIDMATLQEAVSRVGLGVARARTLSPQDRAAIAYHEVGHAIVSRALPGAPEPHSVSVVSRGRSLGATWNSELLDRLILPRSALVDQMAALLGGRAAEEIVFGEPGSGAADDLKRVGEIARRMVCELGMGESLSPIDYPDGNGTGGRPVAPQSEAMARAIEAEVSKLVDEAHRRARAVLLASRDGLERAAKALIEQETLSAVDLARLAPVPAAVALSVVPGS